MSELVPEDFEEMEQPLGPVNPLPIDAAVWQSLLNGLASFDRLLSDSSANTSRDTLLELRNCILVIQQRAAAMRERIDNLFVEH